MAALHLFVSTYELWLYPGTIRSFYVFCFMKLTKKTELAGLQSISTASK